MESIIVNGLIGIVTFVFAVLALGPALLASDNRKTPVQFEEDRIISIDPIPFDRPGPRSVAPRAVADDAPFQREAA
jgi:hypothetical protein